jgi:hypothetical protein
MPDSADDLFHARLNLPRGMNGYRKTRGVLTCRGEIVRADQVDRSTGKGQGTDQTETFSALGKCDHRMLDAFSFGVEDLIESATGMPVDLEHVRFFGHRMVPPGTGVTGNDVVDDNRGRWKRNLFGEGATLY